METFNITTINTLKPSEVIKHPRVREKFITIYNAISGSGGEAQYEKEKIYFNKILADNPYVQKCTPFSIFTAFIDLAVCGLSVEPRTQAQCYLQPRNYKETNPTTGREEWHTRLTLVISGYGELIIRTRTGQIKHADNPVIVYENDEFSFSDRNGRKTVDYVCHLPHKGKNIIACYMHITRADGTDDYAIMTEEDWERLKNYSTKQNNGKTNPLYTSANQGIDPGFLVAKCIKHAFKTYPKVRVGNSTELQSQQTDDIEQEIYNTQQDTNTDDTFAQQPQDGITHQDTDTDDTDDDEPW